MSASIDIATEVDHSRRRLRGARLLLVGIMMFSGLITASAMRRTSATFDEIVLVAGGARGYATGKFDLASDHPPLLQYIYGLPVWLDGVNLPEEQGVTAETLRQMGYRYSYSQDFYFANGNNPERISFLGRLPAVLLALTLSGVVFAYVRRYWGDGPAILSALLVAFLPDVLAHGGVAYTDLPVALAVFVAAWAIDAALRTSSYRRALLAGALAGIAICVKTSAAILLPLAAALAAVELAARRTTVRNDRSEISGEQWLQRLLALSLCAVLAAYVAIVVVYRGDFTLAEFRYSLQFRLWHMMGGNEAAAFLLGDKSKNGWWYFFPIAFLLKTSAAFHLLLLVAVVTLASAFRRAPTAAYRSRLRMPVLLVLLFGAVLLRSNLNIGFRYALPVLPSLCVITAAGIAHLWPRAKLVVRGAIVVATMWAVIFPLTYYPHFLPFISEYGPGRERNHEVLLDSSLDWGQGLIELRDFMRSRQIPRISLSYFGSARPAAYGIDYLPMPSFLRLPNHAGAGAAPEYAVISATNLHGLYLIGDPFRAYRDIEPDTIIAHTLLVYRLPDQVRRE